MRVYNLQILTTEKKIYDGTVLSITVSGENGQLTVLAGHVPMVAMIAKGSIIIRTDTETLKGETGQGILHVNSNQTSILTHSFKWVETSDNHNN